jgi:hypothetical protein
MGSLEDVVGPFDVSSPVSRELRGAQSKLWKTGVYPTRDIASFATTCLNIMMDANLDLQIDKVIAKGDRPEGRRTTIFDLAPQILTLSSGGLQPFDFGLRPDQHHELYLLGQLFIHLHASQLNADDDLPPVMSDEQKRKTLLLMLHLDP